MVQPYVRPLPKEALAKGSLTLSKKDKARVNEGVVKAVKNGAEAKVKVAEKVEEKLASVEAGEDGFPTGYVGVEQLEGTKEEVEIPKEGLVCG